MNTLQLPQIEITRKTKGEIPDIPYQTIKEAILGKRYELSVSYIPTRESIELHTTYKKDPTPANILSFPFDGHSGEILMHIQTIRSGAPKYGHSFLEHLTYLFVHGCLHLKGYDHGTEMERLEKKHLARLGIHLPVHE